jgi:predicted transposase/invertase (TIGR01784 family)
MHTDSWFYRFLKTWPGGFFTLLGLPASLAERYTFDAVELKKSGWRIDGVLRPDDKRDPFYVIEVQAYALPTFYANVFCKVFGYLELNDPAQDWRAVPIFVERAFEPQHLTPYEDLLNSGRVRRIYLGELPAEDDPPLALGIWQLASAPEERIRALVPKLLRKARNELSDSTLSGQVIQLVQEFLVKRFVNLSSEEFRRMFELHDIRDSRVVKEACEQTRRETRRETKETIARRLLAEGVAPATVAKAVGLTVKEIRQLASPRL